MPKLISIVLLFAFWGTSDCTLNRTRAETISQRIDRLESEVKQATRNYMANYPSGNNDPNPVRRRFLGLGENDMPGNPDYSLQLRQSLEEALELRGELSGSEQIDRLSKVINLGLQAGLRGWLIAGNISLLEGLRIAYPNASGSQARPTNRAVPFGCVEEEFPFITIKDACKAQLYYAQGVNLLMDVLFRHRGNSQGKSIMDVDTDPIPSPEKDLPGSFSNQLFPQYSYYVDGEEAERQVIPIQTEANMMGNLLQKQAQATQTIGYRLWTAAYYNSRTQADAELREHLLDTAVHELHAGANMQFMAGIGLAATVGDRAEGTGQSPFELTKLRSTRVNIAEARSTIQRIRNQEKPTLPIDEVMAGDDQVNNLITAIKGSGSGSIQRARQSYDSAKSALFTVHQNQVQAFQEEQTRQTRYLDQLEQLTGIVPNPDEIQTSIGQEEYRVQVSNLINGVMTQLDPDFGQVPGQSELLQLVKQVRFHRQEVMNKEAFIDSFDARIHILENALSNNKSAIKDAEGKITASQLSIGFKNAFRISYHDHVGVSSEAKYGFVFNAGITRNFDFQAIPIAKLQNDITRTANLKEIAFLENSTAEQIRNLLLEQDLAIGELRSQLILLENAEDDVKRTLGTIDRIIAQLDNYNQLTAELYYNDPIYNQELTGLEEKANRDLNTLVANLYKLGKLLEFRWLEPFFNPVSDPGREPISLGNDFENFWSLESAFSLGSVNVRDLQLSPPWEQASNFFDALKAWDEKLRSGIRAFEGDLDTIEISLRQDVFELADVKTVNGKIEPLDLNPLSNPDHLEDRSIREANIQRFRNILLNHGRYFYGPDGNPFDEKYRGFLLPFALSYYDVGFTSGRLGVRNLFTEINAWNFRLDQMKIKIIPASGKQVFTSSSIPIIFAQSGLTSNIDFFERTASGRNRSRRRVREINLDNYVRYNRESLNLEGNNNPYLLFSFAKQNNYPTDAEVPTSATMLSRFWSPFCSRWLLELVPSNEIEIENIEDIVISMRLKSGAPNDPDW